MAVVAVADGELPVAGRASEPHVAVSVEVFLLDEGRIGPLGCGKRCARINAFPLCEGELARD